MAGLTVRLHGGGEALRAVVSAAGLAIAEPDADAEVAVVATTLSRPADADALAPLFADGRVVAVVPAIDRPALRRALDAGLRGCVLADEADRALAATVHAVARGQVVLPHELFNAAPPVFSPREKQVLGMVVLGFTNAEIATKLFIAESTVKSHLNSSFAKLGVRSRAEAASRILSADNGLGVGILAISDEGA